jgi:hypothetical protein
VGRGGAQMNRQRVAPMGRLLHGFVRHGPAHVTSRDSAPGG